MPEPPGEILRRRLKDAGLSHAEASRLARCSTKHMSRTITGHAHLSVAIALALEDTCGLNAEELLIAQARHAVHVHRERAKKERT